MTSQSAFNRRLRRLWGAFILIQQAVAEQLWSGEDCEIMDCVPVPVARGARSFHPGWLADIARIGKGGNDRYFYGLHLLLVVSASGVVTGWTLAAGNMQDRWLAELLLSSRAGQPQLTGPADTTDGSQRLQPPTDWIGPDPELRPLAPLPDPGRSGLRRRRLVSALAARLWRRGADAARAGSATAPGSGSPACARPSKPPSPTCATASACSFPRRTPPGAC